MKTFIKLTAVVGLFTISSTAFSAAPIIGGTEIKDTALLTKIAKIYFGSINGNECSGSRIAPGWLLTAAQCVHRSSQEASTVIFGSGERCKVVKVISYPGSESDHNLTPDLALIEVDCKDSKSPTFDLDPTVSNLPKGEHVFQVGFQFRSGKGMQAEFIIEDLKQMINDTRIPEDQRSEFESKLKAYDWTFRFLTVSSKTFRNAPGDSGGPVYMLKGGKQVLVGVISGSISPTRQIDQIVADYGTLTGSKLAMDFIDKYIH